MSAERNRILTVEAHADDAAWTHSGFIALQTPHSQVDSLLFTDSNAQGIGEQREQEQIAMMSILGMKELYNVGSKLGLKDGYLSTSVYQTMVQALLYVLNTAAQDKFPYTQIVSFGMDGYTGHPDHIMVASVVEYVFSLRSDIDTLLQVGMSPEERKLWGNYFVYIPEIDTRNYNPIDVSDVFPKKINAIKAHESQLSNGGKEHITRLHCLPKQEIFRYKNHT